MILKDNITLFNINTPQYILDVVKSFLSITPVLSYLNTKQYELYIEPLDMNINNLYNIEIYEIYNYFTIYFAFLYIKNIYRQYQQIDLFKYNNQIIDLNSVISNLSIKSIISKPIIEIYIKNNNIIDNITQKNIIIDIEYGNIQSPLNHLFIRTLNYMNNNIDKIFNNFQKIKQIDINNKSNTILNYIDSIIGD